MQISVIIPALDAELFLAQAIRSVLNQTAPPDEVIVVDNGSTDDTPLIARSFAPSVRLIHCDRPGAAAARNRGVEAATGDALMFLDADDLLGPTVLQHLAEALAGEPGAVAVCPWRRYEQRGAGWVAAPASCAPRRRDHDDLAAWLTGWYHPPCSVLWSRDALSRAGGWNPDITVDDDGDLMMRAFSAGVLMARTDQGVAYYRRQTDGTVTLSGRFATGTGLASRLSVLSGIEERLGQTGAITRYHAPLAEAYTAIALDARDVDRPMHDKALHRATAHGGDGLTRRLRRALLQRAARIGEHAPRVEGWFPPPVKAAMGGEGDLPLVSVIVPTFNRADRLRGAIASVQAQTYPNWEMIVVDDASTDRTVEFVEGLDDRRIRIVRHEQNAGVATARNTGMAAAHGAFIAFLDSDDAWMPAKLEMQIDLMQRRGGLVGLSYCGLVTRHDRGLGETWQPHARGNVLPDLLATNIIHLGTSGVLIRREVFDAIGGFDETMSANEDHDYWTRAARFFAFDFVPEPLIVYDQTGEQTTTRNKRSLNFAANMRGRDEFVSRHGVEAARLGVRYRYQMNSACRHLEWDEGSASRGRKLLLKAIRDRPLMAAPYVLMALSVLPRHRRRKLAAQLRSAKATRQEERQQCGSA